MAEEKRAAIAAEEKRAAIAAEEKRAAIAAEEKRAADAKEAAKKVKIPVPVIKKSKNWYDTAKKAANGKTASK